MVPRLVALRRLGGISNLQSGAGLFSAVINANSTERVTPVWLTTHRSGGAWLLGWPVQETMQHLNHVAATRLLRIHGLADQLQLRRLPATKIRSAAGVYEQVQQVVAPAANLLRAAIGEVEDHRVPKESGFQRSDAFLKFHRSSRPSIAPFAICQKDITAPG